MPWGRKTLFCNYSGREVNSVPVADLCHLEEMGYERFRDRLAELLAMDAACYRAATAGNAHYLMRFDTQRPFYLIIRETVLEALGRAGQGRIET